MTASYVSSAIQAASDANDRLIWQQRGLVLAQAHRLQQFEIADWLVLGIEHRGATSAYDYAETVFPQYTRATFQSWVTVAKHFPASIRIESDRLTFGHYQVAQGAERDPWGNGSAESNDLQVARELVWLRKADEHKMSVSALRDAIRRAFELRHEAFLEDHPELKPAEPEPQKPEPKPIKKDVYGADVKEFQTPWLPKRARFHLDELARARRVTTEQLLNRVIQDFLDAHSDEIGDAEAAAKKREAEVFAQMDAAEAAEQAKREQIEKARAEKAAREQRESIEKAERVERHRLHEFMKDDDIISDTEQQNAEIMAVLEAASD